MPTVEGEVSKFTPRSVIGFLVLAGIQVIALLLILPLVNWAYKKSKVFAMQTVSMARAAA